MAECTEAERRLLTEVMASAVGNKLSDGARDALLAVQSERLHPDLVEAYVDAYYCFLRAEAALWAATEALGKARGCPFFNQHDPLLIPLHERVAKRIAQENPEPK